MHPSISATAALLKLNEGLVLRAINDIKDTDLMKPFGGSNTSIMWNFGHITKSRFGMLKMLDAEKAFPWGDIFNRGTFFDPDGDYPPVSEMKKVWQDISKALYEAIDQLTETDLARELPYQYPHGDNTVYGILHFIQFHETYHVGKISLLRSSLGYEGLIK